MKPANPVEDAPSWRIALGVASGIAAALMWAGYMAFARAGTQDYGLTPVDFAVLRYVVAGTVLLPMILRVPLRTLGGVGWGRGAVLAFFAGPIFVALGTGGYLFAPLSHGAVIQPSTAALVTLLLGALVLREPLTRDRVLGTGLMIFGILLIAGRSLAATGERVWMGDLLFFIGGLFWVGYTLALRRWAVPAIPGVAAVSVLSALVVLPAVALFGSLDRILALPGHALLAQLLSQGLGAGVLALVAYGWAVALLGAGRAALFPALVPALTLLVGIPVTGEIPGPIEGLGAGLASLGLAIALGALGAFARRA